MSRFRTIAASLALALCLFRHASADEAPPGFVGFATSDVVIPAIGEWTPIDDGAALVHRESSTVAFPIVLFDTPLAEGVGAAGGESAFERAERVAADMQTRMAGEGYTGVTREVRPRADGHAIIVRGRRNSALHGDRPAFTFIAFAATDDWAGAVSLVVPIESFAASTELIDRLIGEWTRADSGDRAWDDDQLFSLPLPNGFHVVARSAAAVALASAADGASLTVISARLRPLSARGILGLRAVAAGLDSVDGLRVVDASAEASDAGTVYQTRSPARRAADGAPLEVWIRIVETGDRTAAFLLQCNDGTCDDEVDALDASWSDFRWR